MADLSPALISVLRSARAELNQEFAQVKRAYPALDGPLVLAFVARCLDPVVRAVHAIAPERVPDVVRAGYALALDLIAQRATARSPALERCFVEVLPLLAAHVAAEPERVLGALANAVYNLELAGARCEAWQHWLAELGPRCETVEQLLALGSVCAWRAGLAHYRSGALEQVSRLPAAIRCAALGGSDGTDLDALRAALARDPWYAPDVSPGLRVAAQVGSFRGFGGLFTRPPEVRALGEQLLVTSGEEAWLLYADPFGATLHRATSQELAASVRHTARPPQLVLDQNMLVGHGVRLALPLAGQVTSLVATRSTLALTSAFSHAVVLVALPVEQA